VNPATAVADPKGEAPRDAGQTVAARAIGKALRILSKDRRAKGREGAGSSVRRLAHPMLTQLRRENSAHDAVRLAAKNRRRGIRRSR
jgi:hypothetical protein